MTPSVYAFDASIGSLIAHLLDPYLTYPCTPFPHPLTTRGLSTPSSVRRFEVSSCKPTSRDLPSSLVQHRGATVDSYFLIRSTFIAGTQQSKYKVASPIFGTAHSLRDRRCKGLAIIRAVSSCKKRLLSRTRSIGSKKILM